MNPLIKNLKYLPIIYQNLEKRSTNTNNEVRSIKVKGINANIQTTQHFHRSISKIINFDE